MSDSSFELTDISSEKIANINGIKELYNFLRRIIGIEDITTATGTPDERIQCYKNDFLEQIRSKLEERQRLQEAIKALNERTKSASLSAAALSEIQKTLKQQVSELATFNTRLLEGFTPHFSPSGTPSSILMLAFDSISPSFRGELRDAFLSLYTSTKVLDDQFKLHARLQQILGWISQYNPVLDAKISIIKDKNIWDLTQADIDTATSCFDEIIQENITSLKQLMTMMDIRLSEGDSIHLASMVAKIRDKYQQTSDALQRAKQDLEQLRRLQSQLETSEKKNAALKEELSLIRSSLKLGDEESPVAKIEALLAAQERLKETSAKLTQLELENNALRDQLALLEASNAAIEPRTRELAELQENLAAKEQEILRIKALLFDRDASIEKLSALNKELQRDISTLAGRLRTFQEENARLRESLITLKEEYDRRMDVIRAQQKTIDEQAREIGELRAALERLGPDEEEMSRNTTSHESDSEMESAEFLGAAETELSLEIYAHATPPGNCDSIEAIRHNLNPKAIALKKHEAKEVYSPSGQAYHFKITNTQSIATLPKIQQSTDKFAQQKLALTIINVLQNVLINHDVISLDTRNNDIVAYAAHYIHFLNQQYGTTIELKINGKLVNLSAMVKKPDPIIKSLEPEFLESAHWFEPFRARHIPVPSTGLRR